MHGNRNLWFSCKKEAKYYISRDFVFDDSASEDVSEF